MLSLSPRSVSFGGLRVLLARAGFSLAALAASACVPRHPQGRPGSTGSVVKDVLPSRIRTQMPSDRPALVLIERDGDPSGAVAVAVAHDGGSVASLGLGYALARQVRQHGFSDVELMPHELGLQLTALVDDPDRAARFLAACALALGAPLVGGGSRVAAGREGHFSPRLWRDSPEGHLARCSGALGPVEHARPVPSAAELEGWRRSAYSVDRVSFAALGSPRLVDAVATAHRHMDRWPRGGPPSDPWPDDDYVGVSSSPGETGLSVAFWVPDPREALAVAHTMGTLDSELRQRIRTAYPGWHLADVQGTVRPRGGCLLVTLDGPRQAPAVRQVAQLTLTITEEATRLSSTQPRDAWMIDQQILSVYDPREASAAAAWRALSERLRPGPRRRVVSYTPGGQKRAGSAALLQRAIASEEASWSRSRLEVVERREQGQGELWALLATPCGTAGEDSASAGYAALLVRALTIHEPSEGDVVFEPWVSPEGVGILAHAGRTNPGETPLHHAERVGSALGRLLVGTSLSGEQVAEARRLTLHELGVGPEPGWWLALEAGSPGHPSWLEPLGTWQSLTEAPIQALERSRRQLIQGPLRLAVLTNAQAEQAAAAAGGLGRWLRPNPPGPARCPPASGSAPKGGQIEIATELDDQTPSAYLTIPLPTGTAALREQAELTLLLLNRNGGWLDQALRRTGSMSAARARLLGGSRAAVLVVELRASADRLADAVAQLRGLFARLAAGACSQGELDLAKAERARLVRHRRLSPRQRVVDVWKGTVSSARLDLQSLHRFQRRVFRSDRLTVVTVNQKE